MGVVPHEGSTYDIMFVEGGSLRHSTKVLYAVLVNGLSFFPEPMVVVILNVAYTIGSRYMVA